MADEGWQRSAVKAYTDWGADRIKQYEAGVDDETDQLAAYLIGTIVCLAQNANPSMTRRQQYFVAVTTLEQPEALHVVLEQTDSVEDSVDRHYARQIIEQCVDDPQKWATPVAVAARTVRMMWEGEPDPAQTAIFRYAQRARAFVDKYLPARDDGTAHRAPRIMATMTWLAEHAYPDMRWQESDLWAAGLLREIVHESGSLGAFDDAFGALLMLPESPDRTYALDAMKAYRSDRTAWRPAMDAAAVTFELRVRDAGGPAKKKRGIFGR